MISFDTTAAEAVLRQIAPQDLDGVPVYLVDRSELPPDVCVQRAWGWTGAKLDVALQPHLEERGRWRGRGPAIVVDAGATESESVFVGLVVHELAHVLEAPLDLTEMPPNEITAQREAVVQWCKDDEPATFYTEVPFRAHAAAYLRLVFHALFRCDRLASRHRMHPRDLMLPEWFYDSGCCWNCYDTLVDEVNTLSRASFEEIRHTPPPAQFVQAWHRAVLRWFETVETPSTDVSRAVWSALQYPTP